MKRRTWTLLGGSAAFCLIALTILFWSVRDASAPAARPATAARAAGPNEAPAYTPFVPGPTPPVRQAPRHQPIPRSGVTTY